MEKITSFLFGIKDDIYGDFIHKLTPTLPRDYFIGVKIPELRKLSKELDKNDLSQFFKELPHQYYEENLLHGLSLGMIKDYDEAIKEINKFLPFANSWAVSDTMMPKVFKKHPKELLIEIKNWLTSNHTYTVRFAILCLMNVYLDNSFDKEQFNLVNSIHSDEYYIKMMQAWYYATALVKQWDAAIKVIESKQLDKWIHNKSIQKAIESYRISDEQKEYLRTLKIK